MLDHAVRGGQQPDDPPPAKADKTIGTCEHEDIMQVCRPAIIIGRLRTDFFPESDVSRYTRDHPGVRGSAVQLRDIQKTRPFRVLTESDWEQWVSKGFAVLRGLVPQAMCEAVIDMLWEFQEMDPADASTWYKPQLREIEMEELNNTGMVEVYNHQSLWDTRQHPPVYDAFVDIWDREDLWVAIDRANLNPPDKAAREAGSDQGFIHFDVDVSRRPLPVSVQGVLSLKTQGGEIGGFQCVPSIFH